MAFLTNNSKLNENIGLLVCVIILLIVLLFNFDKCFTPVAKFFDTNGLDNTHEEDVNTPEPNSSSPNIIEGFNDNNIELKDENIKINPFNKTITVKFEKTNLNNDESYILLLSKYNNNLEKVGNLDIKFGTDYEEPTTTTTTTTQSGGNPSTTEPEYKHKHDIICNEFNICEYTFTNVEDKDKEGNVFYYRLGVGIIDNTGHKKISIFRFGENNEQEFFRVDNTIPEQRRLLNRLKNLEKLKAAQSSKASQKLTDDVNVDENGKQVYDIDAYMKMLRPFIGNYPDEFTLNQQKLDELSLSKYLNKSMALGEVNVDVDIADLMPEKE